MLDQNRLDPFFAEKAAAEGRRQQAIPEAHEAFNRACLAAKLDTLPRTSGHLPGGML